MIKRKINPKRKLRLLPPDRFAVAACACACLLTASCSQKEQVPDRGAVLQDIKRCNKLVFGSMDVTKTVVIRDDEWYKIGDRIAVYSYDSYLRAYIDLDGLQPDDIDFSEADRTVTLTLPPVKCELTGRDVTLTQEYENIGAVRSNMTSQERAEAKERANASLLEDLKSDSSYTTRLTEAARDKACAYFEALLSSTGYTPVVVFKSSEP